MMLSKKIKSDLLRVVTLSLYLLLVGCSGMEIQGVDVGGLMDAADAMMEMGDKDIEEEIELGRQTGDLILAKVPLSDDEEAQRYVNHVGRWLAVHTERNDIDWYFGVLESPAINAYALPGGYVFVTTGMLDRLHNEAELAGVLGHEIAHIVRKHHLEALQSQAQMDLAMSLGMVAASAVDDGDSNMLTDQVMNDELKDSINELYKNGLDREDELEADRMAVIIAARGGYDPFAYAAVLQTLQTIHSEHASIAALLNSHPNLSDRLAALEPVLYREDVMEAGGKSLSQRFSGHIE